MVGCGGTGRDKVRWRRAVGGSLVFAKLETKKSRPKAAWSSVAVSIHPNLILGRLDARLLEHTGTSVGAFCVGMTLWFP